MQKLPQKGKDILNRHKFTKETESITNLPKQKALDPVGFTGEFHQTFKEEITPIPYNPFQRTVAEGIPPNLYYETSITIIPQPKTLQERKKEKKYAPISLMNIGTKILKKILTNQM